MHFLLADCALLYAGYFPLVELCSFVLHAPLSLMDYEMLEEFNEIVGDDMYAAFTGMLEEIGPCARTHRIGVVIAGMLKYA